jgi:hypothetical protein
MLRSHRQTTVMLRSQPPLRVHALLGHILQRQVLKVAVNARLEHILQR